MADLKLSVKCPSCKFKLTLGSANTVLIWVKHHEYMSYLAVECPRPQCEHNWLLFLDAEDPEAAHQLLKRIKEEGWPMQTQDPAPQSVINDYEEAAEIHLLKQLEAADIEPSVKRCQDRIVATLAWELETATVQDILDVPIDTRTMRTWK